jgi:hypothetical protein
MPTVPSKAGGPRGTGTNIHYILPRKMGLVKLYKHKFRRMSAYERIWREHEVSLGLGEDKFPPRSQLGMVVRQLCVLRLWLNMVEKRPP